MARRRTPAPAGTSTPATAGTTAPAPQPVTEADYLEQVSAEPTTPEEFAAAFDGHRRECVVSGECGCNPFAADGYMRPMSAGERVPWLHWRERLAHTRYLEAQQAA